MSTTWPVRRGAGATALISPLVHFFLDAAVNDRLLFDFPHNVRCLFIFSQPDKGGVPQVTIWRPVVELDLRNAHRLEPRIPSSAPP
jgi:hypothetical protein